VQAVIAKSFAFIYGRNQPSLGLLGISESYKMYGKAIWEKLTESDLRVKVGDDTDGKIVDKRMEW
jgi:3-isopropylmalate dehydratase small subunit